MNRPKTYTVAAILEFINSVFGIVSGLPVLMQGAKSFDPAGNAPP